MGCAKVYCTVLLHVSLCMHGLIWLHCSPTCKPMHARAAMVLLHVSLCMHGLLWLRAYTLLSQCTSAEQKRYCVLNKSKKGRAKCSRLSSCVARLALMYASTSPYCAGPRVSLSQYNPTIDLAFARWTMNKAAAFAKLLGVDEAMQADFQHKCSKLSDYALTTGKTPRMMLCIVDLFYASVSCHWCLCVCTPLPDYTPVFPAKINTNGATRGLFDAMHRPCLQQSNCLVGGAHPEVAW